MVGGGGDPFYLKFRVNWRPVERNRLFSTDIQFNADLYAEMWIVIKSVEIASDVQISLWKYAAQLINIIKKFNYKIIGIIN